jgi:hypothetical protein
MRRATWITVWAGLAIAATFVEAIARLTTRAWTELSQGLSAGQWVALAVLTVTMTYVEGYRALQRRFVPSVVARACEAGRDSRRWTVLAPLYAISLVGVPPRVAVRSAVGIAMIVICVIVVRHLDAPWRGIVDAAVSSALAWGFVALVAGFVGAIGERSSRASESKMALTGEAM